VGGRIPDDRHFPLIQALEAEGMLAFKNGNHLTLLNRVDAYGALELRGVHCWWGFRGCAERLRCLDGWRLPAWVERTGLGKTYAHTTGSRPLILDAVLPVAGMIGHLVPKHPIGIALEPFR